MSFQIVEIDGIPKVEIAGAIFSDGYVSQVAPLSVMVRPFFFDVGGLHGQFLGVGGSPVADAATNYVYLNALGALVIDTVGYPAGAHIRLARVFASGGLITQIFDERVFFTASAAGGGGPAANLTELNKGMSGTVTATDGDPACATALLAGPPTNGWIAVFVNGISYSVGNGTTSGVACYFSTDAGVTSVPAGSLSLGDTLHWNGSVAGFQIDPTDQIDFLFETV